MSSEPTKGPRLVASGLSRSYRVRRGFSHQTIVALDSVDLTLEAGATIALLGRSGSGKSTLGRCLAGLEKPDAGQVFLGDEEITGGRGDRKSSHCQLQLIFQDPGRALNSRFRAIDAVAEPLLIASIGNPGERRDRAASLLLETGVPGELHRHKVLELSGGQRRRLIIARALAASPRVLILDEALSGLDWSLQAQLLNLLTGLRASLGFSMLFISHDPRLMGVVAGDFVVLERGRVVERGPAASILDAPDHPATRTLLEAAGLGRERH